MISKDMDRSVNSPEMHMQSQPAKKPFFSDSINWSRFSEPFSSMPSKQNLMLTYI